MLTPFGRVNANVGDVDGDDDRVPPSIKEEDRKLAEYFHEYIMDIKKQRASKQSPHFNIRDHQT